MTDAVARAAAFVRAHGDRLAQARLAWLNRGQPVPADLLAELLSGQRADGGYAPFWAADVSSVDATCYRLAQALQVGGGADRPEVVRAGAFLLSRQAPSGFWQEDEALADQTPPWATPGNLAATLYLTANAGYLLACLGGAAELNRAAVWLAGQQAANGHLPSFLHTQWLAAGLWLRLDMVEPAGAALADLSTRLPALSANNLSWLMTTLTAAAMAPPSPLLLEAKTRLLALQEEDGRWPSDEMSGRDVAVTLEALAALRHLEKGEHDGDQS